MSEKDPTPVATDPAETNRPVEGIKLLPCPFCGGEAATGFGKHPTIPGRTHLVTCLNCAAKVIYRESQADAIRDWNTRANTQSEVRELVEAATRFCQWDMLSEVEDGPYWKRTFEAALAAVKEEGE